MKIAAFSDTHGILDLPLVDPCDVIVVAGDLIPLYIQRDIIQSEHWFIHTFLYWVRAQECEKVLFVGGNHDFFLEAFGYSKINDIINERGLGDKLVYLKDTTYEYKDKVFYGTPYCEGPQGWAFVPTDTQAYYDKIPKCDVLITHQPPRVEKVGCSNPNTPIEREFGSEKLRLCMMDKDIKCNICGHIHTGTHGGVQDGNYDRMIYNVSVLDERYKIAYPITYIEL